MSVMHFRRRSENPGDVESQFALLATTLPRRDLQGGVPPDNEESGHEPAWLIPDSDSERLQQRMASALKGELLA